MKFLALIRPRLEPGSYLGLIGVPVAWWLEENCLMSYGIAVRVLDSGQGKRGLREG